MKQLISVAAVVLVAGCSPKGGESSTSSSITYEVNPPAGSYNYYPWIIITPADNKTYTIKGKSSAEAEPISESYCKGAPYAGEIHVNSYCRGVTASGAFTFSLEEGGRIAEGSINYDVTLNQNDVPVKAVKVVNGTEVTDFEYNLTEVETYCQYGKGGLRVFVKFQNDEQMGAGKVAYLTAFLSPFTAGETITIDEENETQEAQVFVQAAGDPIPDVTKPENYTTRQAEGLITGKRPPSSCTFEISESTKGAVTKGQFSCLQLGNFSDAPAPDQIPLGEIFDTSGSWQCDSYLPSL